MQAADIMTTDVATVGPTQKVSDVIRCMTERHASGVPVINEAGEVLGIVTEGDLLRRAELGTETRHSTMLAFLLGAGRLAGEYVESHTRSVEEIMTREVATVAPDATLAEVVAMMEHRHIKRLPVVRGGLLVGLVSRADIVRALGRALDAAAAGPTDDEAIRAAIGREMERAEWCRGHRVEVTVEDGVVTLDGAIFDERQRAAFRVLVENVPGVTACIDHITWIEPTTGMTWSAEDEAKIPPTL